MSTESLAEDEPLDPTLERVKRKMMRLLFVSIFILMSGLMAIFGAILYKSRTPAATATTQNNGTLAADLDVSLPEGALVENAVLTDGDRLLVTVRMNNGGTQLLVIGLKSGVVLSRVRLQPGG